MKIYIHRMDVNQLSTELKKAGRSERAKQMERYMKDRFPFLGVQSAERKRILRDHLRANGLPADDQWKPIIQTCWNHSEREMHYCAMEAAECCKQYWDEHTPELFEWMVLHKPWWDTIDLIASRLVGPFFIEFPELKKNWLPRWIEHESMWLNRTAILFQLKYKDNTDLQWLERAILPHISSSEFFHQKAIGWILREYGKTDPNWVQNFVNSHPLKPLSRREALRIINKQ